MNMNKNKHLILDERYVIEHSLNENMSFKAIGKQILKDCTTVSKEVKSHIVFEKKGAPYKPFNDCLNRRHCSHHGDAANATKAATNAASVVIAQPLVLIIPRRSVLNYLRLRMYVMDVIC